MAHLVITLGQREPLSLPLLAAVAVLMRLRVYLLGERSRAFVIFMYDRCKKESHNKAPCNLARM